MNVLASPMRSTSEVVILFLGELSVPPHRRDGPGHLRELGQPT